MTTSCDIGLIGLAVMGQNLVLNIESRGCAVAVHNRSTDVTDAFVAAHPGLRLVAAHTLTDLVATLARPRKVMLMVKAGAAVDALLDQLMPLLDAGDIVIDGGNSLYADTERREARCAAAGLHYLGTGVSGGEEGARKGPAIMPGGPVAAWQALQPIFEAIAARAPDGKPCVAYMGPGGAGHYVKMVHNGIEYGDMQLICEAYAILRAAGLSNDEMADVFDRWNEGDLQSYLIQITAAALRQRDPQTGQSVVDLILDKAGQKGTGQWTIVSAAEQAVPMATIHAAVEARILSSMKDLRVHASTVLSGPAPTADWGARAALVQDVHDALYAAKVVSYAQGLGLLESTSRQKGWQLDLGTIASVWRAGCIIRARFLGHISQAYAGAEPPRNLMLAPFFRDVLERGQPAWRRIVSKAVMHGLPVPAMSASLAYYDSLRTARSSANLLQAQRDFFGAHTYERVDQPAGQWFHTAWPEVIG